MHQHTQESFNRAVDSAMLELAQDEDKNLRRPGRNYDYLLDYSTLQIHVIAKASDAARVKAAFENHQVVVASLTETSPALNGEDCLKPSVFLDHHPIPPLDKAMRLTIEALEGVQVGGLSTDWQARAQAALDSGYKPALLDCAKEVLRAHSGVRAEFDNRSWLYDLREIFTNYQFTLTEKLDKVVADIREQHRVKHRINWVHTVDYSNSWDFAEGGINVLCVDVYDHVIEETLKLAGIPLNSITRIGTAPEMRKRPKM